MDAFSEDEEDSALTQQRQQQPIKLQQHIQAGRPSNTDIKTQIGPEPSSNTPELASKTGIRPIQPKRLSPTSTLPVASKPTAKQNYHSPAKPTQQPVKKARKLSLSKKPVQQQKKKQPTSPSTAAHNQKAVTQVKAKQAPSKQPNENTKLERPLSQKKSITTTSMKPLVKVAPIQQPSGPVKKEPGKDPVATSPKKISKQPKTQQKIQQKTKQRVGVKSKVQAKVSITPSPSLATTTSSSSFGLTSSKPAEEENIKYESGAVLKENEEDIVKATGIDEDEEMTKLTKVGTTVSFLTSHQHELEAHRNSRIFPPSMLSKVTEQVRRTPSAMNTLGYGFWKLKTIDSEVPSYLSTVLETAFEMLVEELGEIASLKGSKEITKEVVKTYIQQSNCVFSPKEDHELELFSDQFQVRDNSDGFNESELEDSSRKLD